MRTLIERLELEKDLWDEVYIACDLDGQEIRVMIDDAINDCIDIVKQHQAESGWVSVDEYRKIAKANDRVFVYDTFCEAVMPSLVRVINGRAGFQLTNGLYAMYVSHVCSMTVPKPPSEVQL